MRPLRKGVAWALFVAAATITAAAFAWTHFAPVDPVAVLDAHAGAARWSEGRSALALGWRPYDEEEKLRDYLKVQSALLQRQPLSERALDLCLSHFYLWRGDSGDLDRAEERLASLEQDAVALNERALVLYEQGRTIEALDAALQALHLDPALAAARFNRALFLQRLHLDHEAERSWDAFLTLEPEGPWADEARAHLAALRDEPAVSDDTEKRFEDLYRRVRSVTTAEALERLLSEPGTRALLDEIAAQGERLLEAGIEWMRALDARGWEHRAALARHYARAYDDVLAGRADARQLDRLHETDDPILAVHYARLALYDAVQRSDLGRAERLASAIRARCVRYGCRQDVALTWSDLASVHVDRGRFQMAEALLERAVIELPDFARGRLAEILMKRAVLYGRIGADRKALQHNREAIAILRAIPGTEASLASALYNAAIESRRLGLAYAAHDWIREARRVAERAEVARLLQRADRFEASMLAEDGQLDLAADRLEAGLVAARETAIPAVVRSYLHELARVRLRQGAAREAAAAIEEALALPADPIARRELRAVGARAWFALGDEAAGMALLEQAVAAAQEAIRAAPDAMARQHHAIESAPILAELAARRAVRGAPEAVWSEVGGAPLRALDGDECFAAILRLEEGFGVWIADRSGTRFDRAPALRSPLDRGGCPAGTRRLTLLDRPGSSALALSRLVRTFHPDVAVVIAASPAAPWPDERIAGTGLVVHSPQPVRLDLGLGFLPAAPREAAAVLRALPGSEELRGEAATPAAVIERAGAHDLLHFGVHGVSHQTNGAASFLLLGGNHGHLEATDILSMPLAARRPVVVLTACRSSTGDGPVELDGGGLPWAFREAGARAVISYQDALEDEAARLFSETFYEAIHRGAGLSDAFERGVARVRAERSAEAAAAFVLGV